MSLLTVGELAAFLDLDDSSYNKKLDKARDSAGRFVSKGIKTTVDVDTGAAQSKLGALGSLISENSGKVAGAGQKMTLGVTLPILGLDAVSLKLAGDLEQSKIAFETMLGSKPKADAFVASLQKFAATTPFEFTDLQLQAKRMIAYGFAAEQVLPMLTNVGDATAALGDPQALETITRAIGQIQSKGKASAEEMLQLSEAGIPAWQMLADSMGESVAQVQKDVTAGTVSSQQAIDALMAGMADKYGGLMAKQSKTLLGQLSNTIDQLKQSAAKFGESIAPIVKPALGAFTWLLDEVTKLPKPVLAVVGVLGGIASIIGPSLWAIGAMAQGMKVIKEVFGAIRAALVVADTTAVAADTLAVEANTAAREANALTPPIGSSGINPVSPLGTAAPAEAGAAAGGIGLLGVTGYGLATAGIFAGLVEASVAIGKATGEAQGVGGARSAGKAGGMGLYASGDVEKMNAEDEKLRQHFQAIATEIQSLNPAAAGAKERLRWLTGQLEDMRKTLDNAPHGGASPLAKEIEKTIATVNKSTPAFDKASDAIKDHTEQLKADAEAAIMAAKGNSQLNLILDAERIAAENGAWLTAQQAADVLSKNALGLALSSTQAMAKANPNAVSSSSLFGAGQQGMQKPKVAGFAEGGSFYAVRPTLIAVGEGSVAERVDVTPVNGGASNQMDRSRGHGLVIDMRGCTFVGTSRDAARQITDMVKSTLGPQVARLERGMVGAG